MLASQHTSQIKGGGILLREAMIFTKIIRDLIEAISWGSLLTGQ